MSSSCGNLTKSDRKTERRANDKPSYYNCCRLLFHIYTYWIDVQLERAKIYLYITQGSSNMSTASGLLLSMIGRRILCVVNRLCIRTSYWPSAFTGSRIDGMVIDTNIPVVHIIIYIAVRWIRRQSMRCTGHTNHDFFSLKIRRKQKYESKNNLLFPNSDWEWI